MMIPIMFALALMTALVACESYDEGGRVWMFWTAVGAACIVMTYFILR